MATIVTRSGKGSPLTNNEVDANFTNLNSDKLESGDTVASLTLTSADINGGTIDGTVIGGASAAAATFTDVTANGAINFTGATVSNGGSVTTVDINGGTIDGTVIGGSTPAAISGTDLTLSGGVVFGATGGSVTSKTLDDYEEGTWTPTDASGAGLAISTNAASYTKIGGLCYIYAYIDYPLTANGAGQTTGGLPFTAKSGSTFAQLTIRSTSITVSASNLTFQVTASGTSGSIYNGAAALVNSDISATGILISGCYEVA